MAGANRGARNLGVFHGILHVCLQRLDGFRYWRRSPCSSKHSTTCPFISVGDPLNVVVLGERPVVELAVPLLESPLPDRFRLSPAGPLPPDLPLVVPVASVMALTVDATVVLTEAFMA